MVHLITYVSKYLLILLFAIYTYDAFMALLAKSEKRQRHLFARQTILMYLIVINANTVLFANTLDFRILVMLICEIIYFMLVMLIYKRIYKHVSFSIVNNMCMLLSISFIMLTRLNIEKAFKQFIIAIAALVITAFVPLIITKFKHWDKFKWFYAAIGILGLALVCVAGSTVYGAKLNITIGPVAIQPSEFVKILFVFFTTCMLFEMPHDDTYKFKIDFKSADFKIVLITGIIAAAHVGILVLSRDLGSAFIFLFTFIIMLYVATNKPGYVALAFLCAVVGGVMAYLLFSHVRVRVEAWQDPIACYSSSGYQVSQSLFAIGTGGWFGSGLCQGSPNKIPVVESDFIFSAISEELGCTFALCLIFVCLCNILMTFNLAMKIKDQFYKLLALGLGAVYGTQVFVTLGGVTKFIPSTGVTLPFVSYGGSSLLSTMFIFAIIQGLYGRQFIGEEDE